MIDKPKTPDNETLTESQITGLANDLLPRTMLLDKRTGQLCFCDGVNIKAKLFFIVYGDKSKRVTSTPEDFVKNYKDSNGYDLL